ncbi:carnitine palmitoyltransferase I [Thecamonas trahens ATCC 50062]|uniref:Carnitine palmitoyltransferase I n=1 Tax=Thecamonas trahens ATCC 50062 TaxID=461836 RepID=A0A0L0DR48_THETB|nr:carnitine palmitoyltransferase I [Thecamonas trahens ATCC 50062]KNC54745.1 carnitine palmitoyltransferase I [Thecamonas trahens ATCC 50062]|eukprot:XP_013761645.1 carnitine palmitoyltransferase I [Thecamonas trahens ATCC 50062]
MAEARAIATLSADFTSNNNDIGLMYTESGLQFRLQLSVPPPKKLARNTKRAVYKLRNVVFNAVYPFGAIATILAVAGMIGYTLYFSPEDCESIFCLGWIYSSVWSILQWMPLISLLPEQFQVVYAAALAGFVFAILLAAVQRYILRGLLTYRGWMWASRKGANLHIKAWALLVKLFSGSSPKLYSFQGSLPRLPVPPLADTVRRYLESIEPVVEPAEFERMTELAHKFLANEGPSLQRYLVLKSWYAANYVSDWWQRFVYLRGRSSICINSNYYTLDTQAELGTSNPVARAARMITCFLEFKRLIDHEEVEPIMAGVTPMCMNQYKQLFSTTRIPGREEDKLVTFEDSRHIVISACGNYYSLPVYSHSGRVLSVGEIEDQLLLIVADAEAHRDESAAGKVPALTGANRTKWAEARSDYFSSGTNKAALNLIETAIFYVHMDDTAPDSWSGRARRAIHGSGSNLWFDKSVELVVFKDAHIGLNVEHSFADALVIAHLWEHCLLSYESLASTSLSLYGSDGFNVREPGAPAKSVKSISTKLKFDIAPGSQAEAAILAAEAAIIADAEDLDLHVHHFSSWGKDACKAMGVSPDAFVQMALQLAYYRDSGGKHVLTYEAASTRLFRNGRTETIRSCTKDAAHFVRLMESGTADKANIAAALRTAIAQHGKLTRNAMTGRGVDRHIFGLLVVAMGLERESEFLSEAMKAKWTLSSSQQPARQTTRWNPNKPVDAVRLSLGGGFGPVDRDSGYGVSYLVGGASSIAFHVSSCRSSGKTNSTRFIGHIDQALNDMRAILS